MKILIEEYQYAAQDIANFIKGLDALENVEGKVCINYVGYFYNAHIQDCVFILPKVLVNNNDLVFDQFKPEEIVDPEKAEALSLQQRNFIYEFAVWIYRAISVYKNSNKESNIVYHKTLPQNGGRKIHIGNSFLEVLLEIVQFNRENQNYFTYILKNLHAGMNKINWTKTIAHCTAYVCKGIPVYPNPVNKKRSINFDEELIVIFFSILNYINETYGFPISINLGFELIKGKLFQNYISGFGKRRLLLIKYKYFSDKALRIWELCYAFFDKIHTIRLKSEQKEYLLAKNFNIVFEAMIDELIGDRKNLPKELLDQRDGKRVDHMFRYKGLTENEEDKLIYYIGDSKYYKQSTPVGVESVYKQFTYARNVIQWNIDLFNNGNDEKQEHNKLRDDITEGYNIIPNFFISAMMDKELSYTNDNIERKQSYPSFHFKNRLFDRDTLLISHYNVNFLFVLSLYARNKSSQKAVWRTKMYEMFREKTQELLKEKFNFYAMRAKRTDKQGLDYLKAHFQEVLGKIYTPFENTNIYSLALNKGEEYRAENERLKKQLEEVFDIEICELGEDPAPKLQGDRSNNATIERQTTFVTIGFVKDENHRKWIEETKQYNLRLPLIDKVPSFLASKYLLLRYYKELKTYKVKAVKIMSKTELEKLCKDYGYTPEHETYIVYSLTDAENEFKGPWCYEKLNIPPHGNATTITLEQLVAAKSE